MGTTQAIRRIRTKPEKAARCRTSQIGKVAIRTPEPAANGFLRTSFLPLYRQESAPKGRSIEQDFFASLKRLTDAFNLSCIDVSDKRYPYNILVAHAHAQEQLSTMQWDVTLAIKQDDNGGVSLVTTEVLDISNTLFYMPVVPLYMFLKDKKNKRTGELLLSICAYLYHGVGVPYYRENDYTYIGNHYACMEEMYMEGLEDEDTHDPLYIAELRAASHYGDIMHRTIYNLYHLNHFGKRIDCYKPQNEFETETLKAAKAALNLLNDYPNARIFRNTDYKQRKEYGGCDVEDEESDEYIIRAEQYISFVAKTEGFLYKQMEQYINEEFGECSDSELPTLTTNFNSDYIPASATLDFEQRLIALLHEVCFLLNNLP